MAQTLITALDDVLDYEEETMRVKRPLPSPWIRSWLKTAVLSAHEAIQEMKETENIQRMGATITAVFIYNNQAYIVNVGDSRTYLWRNSHLDQITSDHTVTNELVKSHAISAAEAHTHAMRHVLTHAVGGENTLDTIDIFQRTLYPGDKLLLCSNGLWQSFEDGAVLETYLAQAVTPADLCWQLVSEANQRDGSDNISAVAAFIEEDV